MRFTGPPPWPLAVAVGITFWLLSAYAVGRYAASKGRHFWPYFAAATVIGWPLPLIAALLIPRRVRSE